MDIRSTQQNCKQSLPIVEIFYLLIGGGGGGGPPIPPGGGGGGGAPRPGGAGADLFGGAPPLTVFRGCLLGYDFDTFPLGGGFGMSFGKLNRDSKLLPPDKTASGGGGGGKPIEPVRPVSATPPPLFAGGGGSGRSLEP